MRGEIPMFINKDLMPYIFVSYNGRLYFSEVTAADENAYFCHVTLTSVDESSSGMGQAPNRMSQEIRLRVTQQGEKQGIFLLWEIFGV